MGFPSDLLDVFCPGYSVIKSLVSDATHVTAAPPASATFETRDIAQVHVEPIPPGTTLDPKEVNTFQKILSDEALRKETSLGRFHQLVRICLPAECEKTPLASAVLESVSADELVSGPLTKIVVYHDTKGVQAIEQFFGGRRGSYQGNRGVFTETTFVIPTSDALVTVIVDCAGAGWTNIDAIRLITAHGKDSGWLGSKTANGSSAYVYEVRDTVEEDDGSASATTHFYPIYAIDLWRAKANPSVAQNLMLATRHTYPFEVSIELEKGDSHGKMSSPTEERRWRYINGSEVEQSIELFEEVTNSMSHTVTSTTTDSATKSLSLSVGVSAMYEGIGMSANLTDTHSDTHTVTQSRSATTRTQTSKTICFPITIPPLSGIAATLLSSKITTDIQAIVHIEYKHPSIEPLDLPITFSGVHSIEYSVDVMAIQDR